jgi:hypothetical protein
MHWELGKTVEEHIENLGKMLRTHWELDGNTLRTTKVPKTQKFPSLLKEIWAS